jgi:hypothetical protein
MSIKVFDPTYASGGAVFERAPRVSDLVGKTVGLISNGKRGTVQFFSAMEQQLLEDFGAGQVIIRTKGNYSAPMEAEILAEASTWDVAFAGIGD